MLEINIKRCLKITHIFSSAMWHLPKEIFDLALESPKKVVFTFLNGWKKSREEYFVPHENDMNLSLSICKWSVIGTQACSFIYVLSVAAFVLWLNNYGRARVFHKARWQLSGSLQSKLANLCFCRGILSLASGIEWAPSICWWIFNLWQEFH